MYKAVIFDLDGTLLNTLDDLADSCNYVLAQKGHPTFSVDQYRSFVGNGAAILMKRIHPAGTSQEELDDSLARFTEYYAAHKDIKTAPYPGIPELLEKIRAMVGKMQHTLDDCRLAVMTRTPYIITQEQIEIQDAGQE